MGPYCEGGESLCEGDCKGVWCPVAGASTALSERASHGRNLHDASAESHSSSTCYIAECGCPPFGDDVPSWCGTGDAGVNGDWCQESEDRCMQCNGLWYTVGGDEGSTCVGPPTPAPEPAPTTQCFNSECGCPPFTDGKPWCSEQSATMGEYCEGSESLCEGDCKGVWCPVAGASTALSERASHGRNLHDASAES